MISRVPESSPMPGPQPLSITLSPQQQALLERLLRQHSAPQALIRRIQIVLAADYINEPIIDINSMSDRAFHLSFTHSNYFNNSWWMSGRYVIRINYSDYVRIKNAFGQRFITALPMQC